MKLISKGWRALLAILAVGCLALGVEVFAVSANAATTAVTGAIEVTDDCYTATSREVKFSVVIPEGELGFVRLSVNNETLFGGTHSGPRTVSSIEAVTVPAKVILEFDDVELDSVDVVACGTPTPTPTGTPTPDPTETATPDPTETATPDPTETATPDPTETATPDPTETATSDPTETATPDPTETATSDPTDAEAALKSRFNDVSLNVTCDKVAASGVYDGGDGIFVGIVRDADDGYWDGLDTHEFFSENSQEFSLSSSDVNHGDSVMLVAWEADGVTTVLAGPATVSCSTQPPATEAPTTPPGQGDGGDNGDGTDGGTVTPPSQGGNGDGDKVDKTKSPQPAKTGDSANAPTGPAVETDIPGDHANWPLYGATLAALAALLIAGLLAPRKQRQH